MLLLMRVYTQNVQIFMVYTWSNFDWFSIGLLLYAYLFTVHSYTVKQIKWLPGFKVPLCFPIVHPSIQLGMLIASLWNVNWSTLRKNYIHNTISLVAKKSISVVHIAITLRFTDFNYIWLACLFVQKTYLAAFLALLPQPCNQGTQDQRKKQQTSPERNTDL